MEINTKLVRGNFLKRVNDINLKEYTVVEHAEQNTIDRYIGPLISSHVVTTSVHPWFFPTFYTIVEPNISLITFIITAIIELFGLGVGSGFILVGLRRFRDNGPNNTNAVASVITAATVSGT